jgi:hypothetical protein
MNHKVHKNNILNLYFYLSEESWLFIAKIYSIIIIIIIIIIMFVRKL